MKHAQARIDYAKWLKANHPEIFVRALKIASNSEAALAGLGEEPTKSFWEKFSEAATGLGTTLLALKNQKEMMKINLARAEAGQPPLDVASTAPAVRTQVELSPELTNRLVSTAGEGLNKTLLLAGAGIIAFILAKRFL